MWSFDYKSKDRPMNEHNFKIQNVRYTPSTGTISWTAHMKYGDKNLDDAYIWRYGVLLLGTHHGESRTYHKGPYSDKGGLDSKSYNVHLNSLFRPITWTNGVKDGNETGVDCGGSSPAVNMHCLKTSVNPGNAASSNLYSLRKVEERIVVQAFANVALYEYANAQGQPFDTFYSGPNKEDRYVEAVADYVDRHMEYVSDSVLQPI